MDKGVFYVAYGKAAKDQLTIALGHLRRVHPTWKVAVVSDERPVCRQGFAPPMWIQHKDTGGGVRDIKLKMYELSPFKNTLYMDVDTRLRYSIAAGWDMLADGWEMLVRPTNRIEDKVFHHIDQLANQVGERAFTLEALGGFPCISYQGGAMWFRKCERVKAFFDLWQQEWRQFAEQDQAALMRALRKVPVRIWTLSRDWNGGCLLGHYHGHARRTGLKGGIN